jgi:hypothetical protein
MTGHFAEEVAAMEQNAIADTVTILSGIPTNRPIAAPAVIVGAVSQPMLHTVMSERPAPAPDIRRQLPRLLPHLVQASAQATPGLSVHP